MFTILQKHYLANLQYIYIFQTFVVMQFEHKTAARYVCNGLKTFAIQSTKLIMSQSWF